MRLLALAIAGSTVLIFNPFKVVSTVHLSTWKIFVRKL